MKRRPTFEMIAEKSGCSWRTVSRVFGGERADLDTIRETIERHKGGNSRHQKIAACAMELHQELNSGDGAVVADKWQQRLTRAKALREEQRLEVVKELYLPADEVRDAITGMIDIAEREFRRAFEKELPEQCEGLSAPEIRFKFLTELDRVFKSLRSQGEEME